MNDMYKSVDWESLRSEIEVISQAIEVLQEQVGIDDDGRYLLDIGDPEQLRINENLIRLRRAKSNSIQKFQDYSETSL
ncbi:MAG: hypothetical protein HOM25_11645 [Rhodospirillaceae bacterium]|jgi:hypothetical protein|nr:hypothetical protein [Rhodospirillaceae bacterium]MBT5666676.1 hypothetical protein [Rhodospirillaceae bacterium]MBT5811595.1 hypothetical protein [Rhodospirillaceae bacterium]